jgi:hypothetical protein
MFFPLTYPAYLLLNRPHRLEQVRLSFWPFYELELAVSTRKGLQKAVIWVEGMDRGLLLGLDRWGRGIWSDGYYIKYSVKPMEQPLVVNPRRNLGVRTVLDGEPPYEDAFLIPYNLSEDEAIDYLESGIQEAMLGERDTLTAAQFIQAYGLPIPDLQPPQIESCRRVLYPFWIVKYTRKETTRFMVLAGLKKSRFDRLEIANVLIENDILSDLLSDI